MAIGATRVFHVNVNCSSLERSLSFYRDGFGLEPGARTAPTDVQPGEALGWEGSCRWDAWILTGSEGFAGTAIDLLEWKTPEPLADPRPESQRGGFERIVLRVDDVDAGRARLDEVENDLGAGSPPTRSLHDPARSTILAVDPDGTAIEVVAGEPSGLAGVRIACRDLARSARFYAEIVGLADAEVEVEAGTSGASTAVLPARSFFDRTGRFRVDLVERPSLARADLDAHLVKGATTARPMQALGIHRLAFLTDDVERDHAFLAGSGVTCLSPPAEMSMGPGLPALRFFCFLDPDGAVLELIEQPRGEA
jgi:catechol 2,3-dioxygenase-like lactoylglutathione lyase family enzyme